MVDFLSGMAIASRRRAQAAERRVPLAEMRDRAAEIPSAPELVLSPDGFDVIAEIKRRSPGGEDQVEILPERRAVAYAVGGAAAVSVLTEPLAFDGSLEDLAAASRALARASRPVPTMRKDFVTDPYQVFEARAAGAGGILLIADLLEPLDDGRSLTGEGPRTGEAQLDATALLEAAAEAELWVLIEAFADQHVERAVHLTRDAARRGVRALIGVNVRDLRTLAVDPGRLARVVDRLPRELPRVAESGMLNEKDVAAAARLGYGVALIGRALSSAPDPRGTLTRMLKAGRTAGREAACA